MSCISIFVALKKTTRPQSAGVAKFREDLTIEEIVKKSPNPPSDIAAIGLMVMSGKVFSYEPQQHANGEYYLTGLLNQFLKKEKVHAVITEGSRSLTKPGDISIIEKFLQQ